MIDGYATVRVLAACVGAIGLVTTTAAQPVNNTCSGATPLTPGVRFNGTAVNSSYDSGSDSECTFLPGGDDIYHTLTAPVSGVYEIDLCGAGTPWDTAVSVHTSCPATITNQLACEDDGCGVFGGPSKVVVFLAAGQTAIIRIAEWQPQFTTPGPYSVLVTAPPTPTGACCINGACTVSPELPCLSGGGQYLGNDTTCHPPTTGTPTTINGAGGTIPDNNTAGFTSTVNVPDTFTLGGVQLRMALTHTWAGDLTIRLSHGQQTALILENIGGPGDGDSSNFGGTYTFTDAAAASILAGAASVGESEPIAPGNWRTINRFGQTTSINPAFAGTSAQGAWTLTVIDNRQGWSGTVASWSLLLNPAGQSPCSAAGAGACCTGEGSATCTLQTSAACAAAGGSFRGAGTACTTGSGNPVACCRANFNRVAGLTVQDLYDYFFDWNSQVMGGPTFLFSADISGTPAVTVQDLYDYLSLWTRGCQ